MNLLSVGPRALLVEVGDSIEASGLAAWARSRGAGAADIVPAACSVLFDGVDDLDALRALVTSWTPTRVPPPGDLVEIAVHYDGADLDDVATVWGTDRDGVRDRLEEHELVAAFCGFAPGFAYLGGLPPELAMPRLDSPRTRVPAGSVALAGPWCGIYPTASPGGWRVVGRTDAVLWSVEREFPALLAPGTRVRFVSAGGLSC